jgi:hypothetical protein
MLDRAVERDAEAQNCGAGPESLRGGKLGVPGLPNGSLDQQSDARRGRYDRQSDRHQRPA